MAAAAATEKGDRGLGEGGTAPLQFKCYCTATVIKKTYRSTLRPFTMGVS
jgi:hypothetical protein